MAGTDEGDGHAAFHTANIMLFCITCKKKYHFLGRNITEISLRTMQVMRAVGGFVIFVILLFEDCIVTRNGNICDYADGWGHRASGCPNRHATLLAANGYANMGPPYI